MGEERETREVGEERERGRVSGVDNILFGDIYMYSRIVSQHIVSPLHRL